MLFAIIVYIFALYNRYFLSQFAFSYMTTQSQLFPTNAALTALFVVIVLVMDRIIHRTDTKPVTQDGDGPFKKEDKNRGKMHTKDSDIFERASTMRSMTVKVKTLKTIDLDMQGASAQSILDKEIGDTQNVTDTAAGTITWSQKSKWIMHMFLIAVFHIYVFYFVPLYSNFTMYGQPNCNKEKQKFYGCFNFKENLCLAGLYVLIILYLWVSARQISLGFPIYRGVSSLFNEEHVDENTGPIVLGAMQIPFIIEARLLIDWVASKTALDMNQFAQAFGYHFELF